MSVYLDTQVAIWLTEGKAGKLSREARRRLEREHILLSPIVLTELSLLREIGRAKPQAIDIYQSLHDSLGVTLCSIPFAQVARESMSTSWTRDPFDRIIVAQASVDSGDILLTADAHILENFPHAVW